MWHPYIGMMCGVTFPQYNGNANLKLLYQAPLVLYIMVMTTHS